jgi:hypothetical protein
MPAARTVRIHKLPIDSSVRERQPEDSHARNMDHGWALEVDGKVAPVGPHVGLFTGAGKARSHYLKKMQPEGETTKFITIA